MKTTIQIDFTFEQVLSLVRQLPKQQKIQLSRELEKEVIDSKLSKLLNAFKSDELDLEVIEEEVENVRQEMYEKQKH